MSEPEYVKAKGNYDGSAWRGDVWTYRNMEVVAGLEEAGRPDLAGELNWATIKAFHGNYWEFLLPSTGAGHGTNRYAWSASQYIGAIIEHLFGVDFDAIEPRVRIAPHVPKALYGKDLALNDLILPTGKDTKLSVWINQTSKEVARITLRITGQLPEGELQVTLPGSAKQISVPAKSFLQTEFP